MLGVITEYYYDYYSDDDDDEKHLQERFCLAPILPLVCVKCFEADAVVVFYSDVYHRFIFTFLYEYCCRRSTGT